MALTDILPATSPFASDVKSGIQFTADRFNPVNMVVNGRSYLDSLANKYLVKPKTARGIAGFVFDNELETNITLQSEITDHYTETNQFVNDHVAHKPMRITLRGLVGELVATPPQGVIGAIDAAQNALTTIQGALGRYTPGAVQTLQKALTTATSVVNKVDNAIMRAQNLVGLFAHSSPAITKQQLAFGQLYGLWITSQVFTVETPYKYFDNMVIEQLSVVQSEETQLVTDISITLKEMRFADTTSVANGQSANDATQNNAGRLAEQAQGLVNKGKTAGVVVNVAKMKAAFGF